MKLHWSTRSPFVRKVMIAAIETGTDASIETVLSIVSLSTVNAQVLKDNPLGKIPTLITDDGQCLYDSLVICEYLDSRSRGARIIPADIDERIDAMRWHALGNGMADALVLWNNERSRKSELQSAPHLAAFHAKFQVAADYLEQTIDQLDRRPFDIAHIAVGVALGHTDFRFADLQWRAGRPRLEQWFDRISQRESFRQTVQFDPAAK